MKISHYSDLLNFPYGCATMAVFDIETSAHAVVIYRHSDGLIYIIDPQNNGLVSGQVHEYLSNTYHKYRFGMIPGGEINNEFYILTSESPILYGTDNRVTKELIDVFMKNPNGPHVDLPPPGMGHYPHEQAAAREQAVYNMGQAAEHWSEMENSAFP
jgi:hypothetical protein